MTLLILLLSSVMSKQINKVRSVVYFRKQFLKKDYFCCYFIVVAFVVVIVVVVTQDTAMFKMILSKFSSPNPYNI